MTQSQVHRQSRSGEEEISVPEFLECISRAGSHSALRPVYDEDSLNWLLTVLAEKRVLGSLHKSVVRGKQRQIIGWYTYYLNPGGVSTVLQMWSSTGRLDEVLNHISYHARHNGSIALTGRMQPAFTKEYSTNQCFLHWRSWMLLHSRDPKILESVENQDAFFTTLEGESWIGIEGELADTGSS